MIVTSVGPKKTGKIRDMCRKPCKECPWVLGNPHSQKWPEYVKKMESIGQIKDRRHACHMITSDAWGYKEKITPENQCIGSLLRSESDTIFENND